MKNTILVLALTLFLFSCNEEQEQPAPETKDEIGIQLPDNFEDLTEGDNLYISEKSDTNIVISNNNPSRLLEAIYDPNTNTFSVLYVRKNKDTVGLDFIHPVELDSLVNTLNPNLERGKLYHQVE